MSKPNKFTPDLYELEPANSSKVCTECDKRLAGLEKLRDWDICRDCDQEMVNVGKKFIYNQPDKQKELDEHELGIAKEKERLAGIEKINERVEKKIEEVVEIKDKPPINPPLILNQCEKCGSDIPKKSYESRNRYRSRRFCSQPCTKAFFRANSVGWFANGNMKVNAKNKKVIEKNESLKLSPMIWTKEEIKNFTDNIPELAGF